MGFVDVAIPGVIGLVAALWPQALFRGSRAIPDPKKIRMIRIGGIVLLAVAAAYLATKLAST